MRHVVAFALLMGILPPASAGNHLAAEPAASPYQAGGVTTIPYTDPINRSAQRRDVYISQDVELFSSDGLRWAFLAFLVGLLAFLLGYLWRPKPVKEKPSWTDIENAIKGAFNKRRTETNAHLLGDAKTTADNLLDEAERVVTAEVKKAFG